MTRLVVRYPALRGCIFDMDCEVTTQDAKIMVQEMVIEDASVESVNVIEGGMALEITLVLP
jgi:hypothetical protein